MSMENFGHLPDTQAQAAVYSENARLKIRLTKLASLFQVSQELIEIQSAKLEESSQHVAALIKRLNHKGARLKNLNATGSIFQTNLKSCAEPSRQPKVVSREVQVFDEEKLGLENQLKAQATEIVALKTEKERDKVRLEQLQTKLNMASKQAQDQVQSFENTKAHLELQIKQLEDELLVHAAAAEASNGDNPTLVGRKRQSNSSPERNGNDDFDNCFSSEFSSTNLKRSKVVSTSRKNKLSFHSKTVVLTGEFDLFDSKGEVKQEIVRCGGRVVGSISGRTDVLVCGSILQDGRPVSEGIKYKEAQARNITVLSEQELQEFLKERKSKPKVSGQSAGVHFVDVVRSKKLRCELPGHTCAKCAEFYNAIDKSMLTEAQRRDLVQDMSRHRYHSSPPPTPPHFWSLPSLSTP